MAEEHGSGDPATGPQQTPAAPSAGANAAGGDRMSVGGVLNETFALYRRFFARFFLLALTVFLVLNLVTALAAVGLSDGGGGVLLSVVSLAVVIVGTFWLQGALVFAVQDVLDGRVDSSISELLGKVTPFLGALVGAGILAGIGIGIGFLLLVVPGVYLLTIWAVIVPAIVLERAGVMEAFGRSRALVSGRFWPVLGVVLVAAVLSAVAQGIVSAVLSFLPPFLQYWLGGAVAAAVAVPFMALAITLTYFRLSEEKGASTPG
jgi:hypothetical protein